MFDKYEHLMLRGDYAEVTKAGVIGSIASELALEPPEWGPREMAHCPLTFRVLCRDLQIAFRSFAVRTVTGAARLNSRYAG